ncbi:unnamed protein product [Adineta ricciae]|uniref:Uncharacterized protein n=1 Tax=Adineta ricciae TaxID=249248 RepID=A0A815MUH2_ADIRI|nr:unnamed protein product [Adineta ricciae]CAF1529855.1 unnamed protein product [Adineta ricciae]
MFRCQQLLSWPSTITRSHPVLHMCALSASTRCDRLLKLEIHVPDPPEVCCAHSHIFERYLTDICSQFTNYSVELARRMERAHSEIDHQRLNQIRMLTIDYLKVTNRFHLRGAMDFIRENKIKAKCSPKRSLPVKKLLEKLLNEKDFGNQFKIATKANNFTLKDTKSTFVDLYHSLSQHAHKTNTLSNIYIDSQILYPLEQFCIGVLFQRYNIPFIYLDRYGRVFPWGLNHVYIDFLQID